MVWSAVKLGVGHRERARCWDRRGVYSRQGTPTSLPTGGALKARQRTRSARMGKKRSGGAGHAAGGEGAGRRQVVTTEAGLHRVTVAPGNAEAQAVAQQHHRVPLKVRRAWTRIRKPTVVVRRYSTPPAARRWPCTTWRCGRRAQSWRWRRRQRGGMAPRRRWRRCAASCTGSCGTLWSATAAPRRRLWSCARWRSSAGSSTAFCNATKPVQRAHTPPQIHIL